MLVKLFVSIEADGLDDSAERLSRDQNVVALRQLQNQIDHGQKIWRSWVEVNHGEFISGVGGAIRLAIPAALVPQLDALRMQFADEIAVPVSIGLGHTLGDADKALAVAKKRGGDKVLLFDPDMVEELARDEDRDDLGDLAKGEPLAKMGAMQRLAPFNPHKDRPEAEEESMLYSWQHNENERVNPGMDKRPRQRALHRLAAQTKIRKNPETGEREFLLHRGMGHEEHSFVHNPANLTHPDVVAGRHTGEGMVNHAADSSWTPVYSIARTFASGYGSYIPELGRREGGKVVSAWVPESSIGTIPRQFGKLDGYATDSEFNENYKPPKGANDYNEEWEVIVHPDHNSKLATREEVTAIRYPAATLDGRVNGNAHVPSGERRHGTRDRQLFREVMSARKHGAPPYMTKAEPAANQGAHAGFQGRAAPAAVATPGKPAPEGSEHSEGEQMARVMENSNPGPPETTHSVEEFEDHFHDLASKQEEKDEKEPEAQPHDDETKHQVVQVLVQLKQQAPLLEQVRQAAPEIYQSVMSMAQALIALAKQIESPKGPDGEIVRKSSDEVEGLPQVNAKQHYTESPEFKAWFGDWQDPKAFTSRAKGSVSHAFDHDTKKPLVLYHGTNGDFSEFQVGRPTINSHTFGQYETKRHGIFATPDRQYPHAFLEADKPGQNIMPVHMAIHSPFDLRDHNKGLPRQIEELAGHGVNPRWVHSKQNDWELFDGEDGANFVRGLKSAGYDGAILHETGSNGITVPVYVAFDPHQVKSATGNIGAFDPKNPDITKAEQLAKMAAFQHSSPAFQAWFQGSHVKHNDGTPMRVYHGTTHDFNQFSTKGTNPENYFGRGHYFTDSAIDVGANYASTQGPDLTQRIEMETERLAGQKGIDYKDPKYQDLKTQIAGKLTGPAPRTVPVYLSMKNPVKVMPKGGTFYDYEDGFDPETGEEGKPKGKGVRLLKAIHKVAQKYQKLDPTLDPHELTAGLWERMADNGGIHAHDVDEHLRTHEGLMDLYDDKGQSMASEFIKDVFRATGHDGIIHNADRFKNMQGVQGTNHYIVFHPHQIKSAVGNDGSFDPKSKDFGKDELDPGKAVNGDSAEAQMEKASLNVSAKKPSPHHHVVLPVGSKVDPGPKGAGKGGRIKVSHTKPNGESEQGWISARAGQVLSEDGHAISAKNPKGR